MEQISDCFLAPLEINDNMTESEKDSQIEKHLKLNGIILDWVDGKEQSDTVLDAVDELHGDVDIWLYNSARNADILYEMDGRYYEGTTGGIIVPSSYQWDK